MLAEFQYLHFVFQRGPNLQRCFLHNLPLLVREHIKKDGAVRSVFFCVLISRWCSRMGPRCIFLSFTILVPRLSAPLPLRWGRHSFVPFILALPVPQGLTLHAQPVGQLCQIDFLATAPALYVFSPGGITLRAPPRHSAAPPLMVTARAAYIYTPRGNVGLRRTQARKQKSPQRFRRRLKIHTINLSRKSGHGVPLPENS